VARVDLKADRRNGALLVCSTHYEPGIDRYEAETALSDELASLAAWLGLESAGTG